MTGSQSRQHANAVDLDRPHTDTEIVGDHLVRTAGDETIQNLAFARAELGDTLGRRSRCTFPRRARGMRQRLLDRAKELLVVNGLFEDIDGARLHRPHGSLDIAAPGRRNQGKATAETVQSSLQLQAIHPRHPDIQEDAAVRQSRRGLQEAERRFMRNSLEAGDLQKPFERSAAGCVGVDDVNGASHAIALLVDRIYRQDTASPR
jgi:hypothetical protein